MSSRIRSLWHYHIVFTAREHTHIDSALKWFNLAFTYYNMQQFVFPIALQKQSITCMSTLCMSCSCSNICEFDAVGVLIGQSPTVFLSKMLACQIFHNHFNLESIIGLTIIMKENCYYHVCKMFRVLYNEDLSNYFVLNTIILRCLSSY